MELKKIASLTNLGQIIIWVKQLFVSNNDGQVFRLSKRNGVSNWAIFPLCQILENRALEVVFFPMGLSFHGSFQCFVFSLVRASV